MKNNTNYFYYISLKNTTRVVIAGQDGGFKEGLTTKSLNITRRRKKDWAVFTLFLNFFFKSRILPLKISGPRKSLVIRYKGATKSIRQLFFVRKKLIKFFYLRGFYPQGFEYLFLTRHNGCRLRKKRR